MRINTRFLVAALVVGCCGLTGCVSKNAEGPWYKVSSYSMHSPKFFKSLDEEEAENGSIYAQESAGLPSSTSTPEVSVPMNGYTSDRLARSNASQNITSGANLTPYPQDHFSTPPMNPTPSNPNASYAGSPQRGMNPNMMNSNRGPQREYDPNTGASPSAMQNYSGVMANPDFNRSAASTPSHFPSQPSGYPTPGVTGASQPAGYYDNGGYNGYAANANGYDANAHGGVNNVGGYPNPNPGPQPNNGYGYPANTTNQNFPNTTYNPGNNGL